jgi:sodium/potassium/calcium exchanger 6
MSELDISNLNDIFLKFPEGANDWCVFWQNNKEKYENLVGGFDLVNIYLCYLSQNKIYLIIFSLICIMVIFRLMSFITDEYASPALLKFAEIFKLSNVVAGATLIAFANGAGEVITSISSGESSGDPGLILSILYGSEIFVQCLIFGITIIKSKTIIQLDKKDILRDYGFLLVCNLLILFIGFIYKKITILIGVLFVSLYVIYVVYVVLTNRQPKIKPN